MKKYKSMEGKKEKTEKAEKERIEIPYGKGTKGSRYFYLEEGYSYEKSAVNKERIVITRTGRVRSDGAKQYLAENNDGHGSAIIIFKK